MSYQSEPGHWLSLAALTVIWGSSFLFTKIAVAGVPVEWVVSIRLGLGAALLALLAIALRRAPPRGWRAWVFLWLIGLFGNMLPFSLITWGQRSIDSGLAAILMAVMPLVTLGLAHWFIPGERLTRFRVAGFVLGFAGVVVLIGPQALLAIGGERGPLLPMLAVLAGACSYGVSAILARLRPGGDALTTAAIVTSIGMLLSLPLAVNGAEVWSVIGVTAAMWGALAFLGLVSTGVGMLIYFRLIHSAGPGFVSQLNYLIPPWAVTLGVVADGERLTGAHLAGLGLILTGILVARRKAALMPKPPVGYSNRSLKARTKRL